MCVNRDCKNYKQQMTVDRGDFVCPECGKTLTPIKSGAGPSKKMWIAGIIGAVVIAAAVAVMLISQGPKEEPVVEDPVVEAPVDTVAAVEEPAPTDTVVVEDEKPEVKEPSKPVAQPVAPSLPYGKYNGPMSDGKPHGVGGTVTVTTNYTLDLNDGSTVSIAPGDKIENTKFQNGRLVQGEIQRTNGDRKWITLGASNGR